MPRSAPELPNGLLGMSVIISVADNVELVRKKVAEENSLTGFRLFEILAFSKVSLSNNNMASKVSFSTEFLILDICSLFVPVT